jgi:hypothetical protein
MQKMKQNPIKAKGLSPEKGMPGKGMPGKGMPPKGARPFPPRGGPKK